MRRRIMKKKVIAIRLSIAVLILTSILVVSGCPVDSVVDIPTNTISDITSPNIGLLKVVPAGSFQRDSTPENISIITSAFRISEKEITRAQFLAIMGTDTSNVPESSGTGDPVQQANWYHAIAFCNKLSIAESLTPVYSVAGVDFSSLPFVSIPTSSSIIWDAATANWSANGYRLPTEMEWMWAAMGATSGSGYADPVYLTGYGKLFAGSNSTLANGSGGTNLIDNYAWHTGNSGTTTHPAGSKNANELGLYDMAGNVWNWNWDWYNAPYPAGTLSDYRGVASGTFRVYHGGSWFDSTAACSVGLRVTSSPPLQDSHIGFRVVRP